jgi:hypothetical protein
MKYHIVINQLGIFENDLLKKTDLIDWCIIDCLRDWYFAQDKKTIFVQDDGCNYVWVNYNHLIQELPIIGIKDRDALTKRFKKLKQLGLIKTFKDSQNNLYFILTPKCIEVIGFKPTLSYQNGIPILPKSDTYPTVVGQRLSDHGRTAQIYNQSNNNNKENNNILLSSQFSNENCSQHSANAEVVKNSLTVSKNKKKNNKDDTEKQINEAIRELLRYFDEWFHYLFKVGYNCEFKVEFDLLKRDFKRYLKDKNNDVTRTKNYFLDLIDIYFTLIKNKLEEDDEYKPNPTIRLFHIQLSKLICLHAKDNFTFYRLDEILKEK